jgi:hypothetical protein
MTTGTGSRPKKHPHAAARVYNGEAFIVLPHEGKYKILNDCGSRVWELMDGSRTIGDIAHLIEEEYKVTLDKALADVIEFVNDLREHKMLASDDDDGAGKVA